MHKKITEILNSKSSDIQNLEEFLAQLRDMPHSGQTLSIPSTLPIHSIHVIGFHHKQGSIVEYSYPEPIECDLLPYLALPDCAHNETVYLIQADTFFFTLKIDSHLKHCVSCFRQIPNENITEEMNRNFIQKAIVVVSNLPFYGIIASKMQPTTQVYFEQKDFANTSIFAETFELLQNSLNNSGIGDLSIGYSNRVLLHFFKEKVMIIWKLLLIQGRIIVFSKKASQVSSIIYSLLSLYPGQLCFNNFQFCPEYLKHLSTFGLPLKIFDEDFAFFPYFSLFQLAEMEKKGYLIGCTNQMIVEHPRSAPHAVINLETMKIKFSIPSKLAKCTKLNSHENKFIKDICKVKFTQAVDSTWNNHDEWTSSGNITWTGSHNFIQAEFHKFFKSQLANLALLRLKLQGHKIETTLKLSKEIDSKKNDFIKMNPKLKKIWRYKKFMKGLKNSFLFKWSNTKTFQIWLESHKPILGYLSEFCGKDYEGNVVLCEVFYENGHSYYGSLCQGKRNGVGTYITHEYKYEGEWVDDKVNIR